MNNLPQQEKKNRYFFAYGSPKFVIGALLFNAFLNSDEKDGDRIFNFIFKFFVFISIIITIWIIYIFISNDEKNIFTSPFEHSGMSINMVDKYSSGVKGGWDDLSMMGKKQNKKICHKN